MIIQLSKWNQSSFHPLEAGALLSVSLVLRQVAQSCSSAKAWQLSLSFMCRGFRNAMALESSYVPTISRYFSCVQSLPPSAAVSTVRKGSSGGAGKASPEQRLEARRPAGAFCVIVSLCVWVCVCVTCRRQSCRFQVFSDLQLDILLTYLIPLPWVLPIIKLYNLFCCSQRTTWVTV